MNRQSFFFKTNPPALWRKVRAVIIPIPWHSRAFLENAKLNLVIFGLRVKKVAAILQKNFVQIKRRQFVLLQDIIFINVSSLFVITYSIHFQIPHTNISNFDNIFLRHIFIALIEQAWVFIMQAEFNVYNAINRQ